MRTFVLVLAGLAFAGDARRLQTNAAFNPSIPGRHSVDMDRTMGRHANRPTMKGKFDVRSMAGVSEPVGFFDPFGYSIGADEGKVRFYREVELKHGRVAMLAALGFLVGEQYHPLFGGNIDDPSLIAFQDTPLQTFWGVVVLAIAIPEVFSVLSFDPEVLWSIKSDHEPGDLGFDPMGLKPTDAEEMKTMQTKELNNGRLAMLAIAGMVAQEMVTGEKLF